MAGLFISIGRMPFLTPTLDNVDPFFVVVLTLGFCPDDKPSYLHHGCIFLTGGVFTPRPQ